MNEEKSNHINVKEINMLETTFHKYLSKYANIDGKINIYNDQNKLNKYETDIIHDLIFKYSLDEIYEMMKHDAKHRQSKFIKTYETILMFMTNKFDDIEYFDRYAKMIKINHEIDGQEKTYIQQHHIAIKHTHNNSLLIKSINDSIDGVNISILEINQKIHDIKKMLVKTILTMDKKIADIEFISNNLKNLKFELSIFKTNIIFYYKILFALFIIIYCCVIILCYNYVNS